MGKVWDHRWWGTLTTGPSLEAAGEAFDLEKEGNVTPMYLAYKAVTSLKAPFLG